MSLSHALSNYVRVDSSHAKALKRLQINTAFDLLYHLPVRYENIAEVQSVSSLRKGQESVVYGQLTGLKTRQAWRSKKPIAEGYVEDSTAKIKVIWFNQPYIAKMYSDGSYVKLSGSVSGSDDKPYLSNPQIERLTSLPIDRHDSIFAGTEHTADTLYPIYRETKGITSRWLYHAVLKLFEKGVLDTVIDPIPANILSRYNLPDLATALFWIHSPKKISHAKSARKRFAFEEVFYIQVQNAENRAAASAATAYNFNTTPEHINQFTNRFPFSLTESQNNSIKQILADFGGSHAMSRLLEGDVGSGKTAVAATTAYAVATSRPPEGTKTSCDPTASVKSAHLEDGSRRGESSEEDAQERDDRAAEAPERRHVPKLANLEFGNLQVAYMAPTEILARQHFESFIEYFKHLPLNIGLLTGSGCMKFPAKTNPTEPTKISKAQLLKWVKSGEISILIGTHALIYKSVEFKHLAYVIIDEQHRFGTNQRKQLAKKDTRLPHLLSMTATPIPRTLALTIYGDLDITLLDQMPTGRKPIKTTIVGPGERAAMYEHIRTELASGRQAYVICPRIDEPDPDQENTLNLKSVTAEAEHLEQTEFSDYRIAILHGKMKPDEKAKVMQDFHQHKFDVLVATSVVEVGVNVPNATNIIIEGAERFGLSQLHQLRGRVVRGQHQPYCFAVTESKGAQTRKRLSALATAANGFALAEYDLEFRGVGELYGGKQSGLSDLGMEAIRNLKLVEAARKEARHLVDTNPDLSRDFPLIAEQVGRLGEQLHLE